MRILIFLPFFATVVAAAVVEYTFDVRPTLSLSPDCFLRREVLAVNNMIPGPVVRANFGDTIRVTVNNHSPSQSLSIHWHGLHQKGTPYSDGFATVTQCPLGPLQSEVHEFIADVPGTHYWHGHSSLSRMDGMEGFLIVDDPTDEREQKLRKKYDEEILIFLQDWYHRTGQSIRTGLDSNPFVFSGDPQSMLINEAGPFNGCDAELGNCDQECVDKGYTTFNIEKGKTYRLRLVNAAASEAINFAVENHELTVVEADGTLVKKTKVDSLDITNGQRYSVLLKAKQDVDNYWAHITPRFASESHPSGHAIFQYTGAEPITPGDLPTMEIELDSETTGPAFDAKLFTRGPTKGLKKKYDKEIILVATNGLVQETFAVKIALNNITQHFTSDPVVNMAYKLATEAGEWPTDLTGSGLNEVPSRPAKAWNYTASQTAPGGPGRIIEKSAVPIISLRKGETVQIVLQNAVPVFGGPGVHPFHLHGHSFYVVGQGEGIYDSEVDQANFNLKNAMRRDTATMWPFGWTALRFVANNPGVWGFHCHNAVHNVMGMGVLLVVAPDELPPPPEGVTSCTKTSF